ncbi:hypothetical protein CLV51_102699 [Chitinophaga niastensis]|uniref:Uncharacterized protein n=1 Tax=Chitinophaga niastensis TaxID=536980 RepID=A0A2P8HNP9_CHINA|nr:hypothetical protein [Chitinophaga niastensis]PSL47839.1 hypothetical protein CLV51_102699 [Chitinophaga niastensis]
MFTGIFSSSLQRKFCEGFLFFPIKRLRQYGHFIFKQYKPRSGVKAVLDHQTGKFDFHARYAFELSRLIADKAIPQASLVIGKMEALYEVIREGTHNSPDMYPDFNDVITGYYHAITTYNGVVLGNLQEEMKPALKKKVSERMFEDMGYDHHIKVQRLIKEFVGQSQAIVAFLQSCVDKDYGFPANYSSLELTDLITGIKQVITIQRNLIASLQAWGNADKLQGRQVYYN